MTSTHATATAARPAANHPAQDASTPENSRKVTPRDATAKVMSLPRVTRVTQLSDSALRARVRRASDESYVTHVISMLTSDTSDTTLELSVPLRAYALAVGLSKSHVTSVTGLERLPK